MLRRGAPDRVRPEAGAGGVILLEPGMNEKAVGGAHLATPDRAVTLTPETGLGSKRKPARHSEKRNPAL